MKTKILSDKILIKPEDITYKPIQEKFKKPTEIIGIFNPALTRYKDKIILMARVTEKFKKPYKDYPFISWLLPIELDNNLNIKKIHYKKAILPKRKLQEFGVEDPRITKINNKYYMTVVGYSKHKICTYLYELNPKTLNYKIKSMIFDHINKNVVLFPKKINKRYVALTRPTSRFINLAYSKDLIYWKPSEFIIANIKEKTKINKRIGAGPPPILTKKGWLQLIHGVEHKKNNPTGYYRMYALLLNKTKPYKILKGPSLILEANKKLDKQIKDPYIKNDVVFTTGLIKHKNHYLLASGELDTAIRLTELDIKI